MKKSYLIILLLAILLIPFKVNASGSFKVSSSSITMYPGESKTITITTSDSVGKINISSSNSGVASVSVGSVFIDTVGVKKTFTIKAGSIGSATVSVVGSENYASFSDEVSLKGMTKTIKVNVVEKPVDNRSKNNKLKSISVDGFNLVKVNDNNYTLNVNNDVTSINIKATAEDEKATVSGAGKHNLNVGENKITVTITAENQSKNTVTIKVIRKDGYYLEDLDSVLKENNNNIDIIIKEDSKLSDEILEKVKNNKKIVKFNYFGEDKKLLYSWIIDGTKIKDVKEFDTSISYSSSNEEVISELSNYADGLYINFNHEGKLPEGTKVKVYVADNFKSNNLVNIYHYVDNKLVLVKEKVMVNDNYIEFDIEHCSEYFVTRSTLSNEEITSVNVWIFVFIELVIIILLLVIIVVLSLKCRNKNVLKEEKINITKEENIVELSNNSFFETKKDEDKDNL